MFKLIAGPCVIEDQEMTFNIAKEIKQITDDLGIEFYFKASFDKANRTSIHSFRGPGIKKGLDILKEIKNKLNIKVVTDIHESSQAEIVGDVVDVIQIPAFLSRQTDLIVKAANTGKIINVKKGQFLSPSDMINVINKIEESKNKNIFITERGTFFGYNNLVVDFTSIIELKKMNYPVFFDATHSVQKPGGKGTSTGGNREYAKHLAKAAIAVGSDGIFMEVHPNPENAKSDGPNMIKLENLREILIELKKIYSVSK